MPSRPHFCGAYGRVEQCGGRAYIAYVGRIVSGRGCRRVGMVQGEGPGRRAVSSASLLSLKGSSRGGVLAPGVDSISQGRRSRCSFASLRRVRRDRTLDRRCRVARR